MAFAVAGLSRTLTRIFVMSIGGLILLHHFNISITPAGVHGTSDG